MATTQITKCFGRNNNGQTDITTNNVSDFTSGTTLIAAGTAHTCMANSTLIKCYGSDATGQSSIPSGVNSPLD